MQNSALVTCTWLKQNLDTDNLVILDASFFLPRQQRQAHEEYRLHIPHAIFFDIDQVADHSSSLPHTLPPAEQFAHAVGHMGIAHDTQVIIYDNNHFFAAARAWWMFRVFGHNKVNVLDGGLAHWKQSGFTLDNQLPTPVAKMFTAKFRPELMCNLQQMQEIQQSNTRQILDARSADSFLGLRQVAPGELATGHIPNSINIPYARLTTQQHKLISPAEIHRLLSHTGVNLARPMLTTCGSGVSAAVLLLALYQIGLTEVPMYDGSWAEWGSVRRRFCNP